MHVTCIRAIRNRTAPVNHPGRIRSSRLSSRPPHLLDATRRPDTVSFARYPGDGSEVERFSAGPGGRTGENDQPVRLDPIVDPGLTSRRDPGRRGTGIEPAPVSLISSPERSSTQEGASPGHRRRPLARAGTGAAGPPRSDEPSVPHRRNAGRDLEHARSRVGR